MLRFLLLPQHFWGKQNIENKPSKGETQRGGWKYYYTLHMCLAWHVSALPAFLNTSCQVTLLQAFFLLLFLFPSPVLFSFY